MKDEIPGIKMKADNLKIFDSFHFYSQSFNYEQKTQQQM